MTGSRRLALAATGAALLGAGLGAAALGLAHAAPTLTAIGPMRRRLLPGLSGHGESGHIALTFNDGPDPRSTPAFMGLLADRGVHATFFVLGSMLARAPDLGAELVAAGHEVALHGYTHRGLLWQGPYATLDDLARGRDLITESTGQAPIWYRPPYGILTTPALHAARRLGLTTRLWTCSGRDTNAHATPTTVHDAVVRHLAGGRHHTVARQRLQLVPGHLACDSGRVARAAGSDQGRWPTSRATAPPLRRTPMTHTAGRPGRQTVDTPSPPRSSRGGSAMTF
jgi:peptidoglycan/xylan/chitin deacetylase (PgdA/CDA1 family)